MESTPKPRGRPKKSPIQKEPEIQPQNSAPRIRTRIKKEDPVQENPAAVTVHNNIRFSDTSQPQKSSSSSVRHKFSPDAPQVMILREHYQKVKELRLERKKNRSKFKTFTLEGILVQKFGYTPYTWEFMLDDGIRVLDDRDRLYFIARLKRLGKPAQERLLDIRSPKEKEKSLRKIAPPYLPADKKRKPFYFHCWMNLWTDGEVTRTTETIEIEDKVLQREVLMFRANERDWKIPLSPNFIENRQNQISGQASIKRVTLYPEMNSIGKIQGYNVGRLDIYAPDKAPREAVSGLLGQYPTFQAGGRLVLVNHRQGDIPSVRLLILPAQSTTSTLTQPFLVDVKVPLKTLQAMGQRNLLILGHHYTVKGLWHVEHGKLYCSAIELLWNRPAEFRNNPPLKTPHKFLNK